jgi:hypothetical protein
MESDRSLTDTKVTSSQKPPTDTARSPSPSSRRFIFVNQVTKVCKSAVLVGHNNIKNCSGIVCPDIASLLFTGCGKPLSKPLSYEERGFDFSPFPTREGG